MRAPRHLRPWQVWYGRCPWRGHSMTSGLNCLTGLHSLNGLSGRAAGLARWETSLLEGGVCEGGPGG